MGSSFAKLPEHAQHRVRKMASELGGCEDDTVEQLSQAWLEKMHAFSEKMHRFGMVEVAELGKDEARGALIMTYSGSVLLIGPPVGGVREASYSSVGSRATVPPLAEHESSVLADDVRVNNVVTFSSGPVLRTSEVYKIGVCRTRMSVEEQAAQLSAAAGELSGEFAELNHTILGDCG